jgi:hypothetical protein
VKLKSVLLAGVLALATLSLGIAKTYGISFSHPTKAGSVQLSAGTYKLAIDGNKATFTEVKTSKSVTVDVKVENAAKSFADTKLEEGTEGGNAVLKDIEVGGSKIKIDF